ncbi:MAG: energy coupling factor transporter S component ThiW [Selenomonadaceae bacterium]|nr:energy coupling factor transporter S component ThiW [Selenomonadaceae bacterium]
MNETKRLTLAAVLTAVAVVGSVLSFPMLGSRCAPVQHMVNVFCAVLLGWRYGVGSAFVASVLRNLFGLGSLLAFPGSMCGAFLSGVVYSRTKNIWLTVAAEALGTGIIGGLAAYPIAILFMGKEAGDVAFYVYVVPFLISTVCGSLLAGLVVNRFKKYLNWGDNGA